MITFNARGEVVVPFFRVGVPELNLDEILELARKAAARK